MLEALSFDMKENLLCVPLRVRNGGGKKQRKTCEDVMCSLQIGFREQVTHCNESEGQQINFGAAEHEFDSAFFFVTDKTKQSLVNKTASEKVSGRKRAAFPCTKVARATLAKPGGSAKGICTNAEKRQNTIPGL